MIKDQQVKEERQPFKTNFGPEEGEREQDIIAHRTKRSVHEQRQYLQNQIAEKEITKRLQRENEVTVDKIELDKNAEMIRMQNEQRLNERNEVKNFWRAQLSEKQNLKTKEQEAQAALKQKVEVNIAAAN